MTPAALGSSSLPRGFRLPPQTPEPFAETDETFPPSPPRPRFRLKRRVASVSLAATQGFLASVAAADADVPIPSIEVPEPFDDEPMHDTTYPVIHQLGDLSDCNMFDQIRGHRYEPPKTPAPDAIPCLSPMMYPNWSVDSAVSSSESSPECEDSRPSTSRSTQTSASAFSTRFSLAPEEASCTSPTKQAMSEPFPQLSAEMPAVIAPESCRSGTKLRRIPWTKAMSQHLWSTYLLYLQDPKVTPFRPGKSGIPPHGVCIRVAREAKRSWKGSKVQSRAGTTPVSETFIQWPHTHAATLAHLRDICKLKATSQPRNTRMLPNSPAPSGRPVAARYWNRRTTPAQSLSAFGNDMSVSLALSTSESMQPHGPLAQLASSATPVPMQLPSQPLQIPDAPEHLQAPAGPLARLGSPFLARSYGPSSTEGLDSTKSIFGPEIAPPRQANTNPRHGLQSPVRMSHTRSKSAVHKSTPQKQRSRAVTNDPRRARRPSVSELFVNERPPLPKFTMPLAPPSEQPMSPTAPAIQENPADNSTPPRDDEDAPRTPLHMDGFWRPRAFTVNQPTLSTSVSFTATQEPPIRLGSPFVARASFSFPNRYTTTVDTTEMRRPFSTLQPAGDLHTPRNVADRLAHVDRRLREVHQGHRRRRSDCPY